MLGRRKTRGTASSFVEGGAFPQSKASRRYQVTVWSNSYEVLRPLYLQGESPCSTNCSFRWIGWGRVGAVMGRLNLPRQGAEKAHGMGVTRVRSETPAVEAKAAGNSYPRAYGRSRAWVVSSQGC